MKPEILSVNEILMKPENRKLLRSFYEKTAFTFEYCDGLCHNIYLDLDDWTLFEVAEASENTWTEGPYILRIYWFQALLGDMGQKDYDWESNFYEFEEEIGDKIHELLDARGLL